MYPPIGRAAVDTPCRGQQAAVIEIPTDQSADFSDGNLRLAVFDLAKSLIM
jgi:hypothetical protein